MGRLGALACGIALLACALPAADELRGADPVEHVYSRPGGVELKAYVFSPMKGGAASSGPAVVLFHGGGSAGVPDDWSKSDPEVRADALARADEFLKDLGYIP